MGWGAVFKTGRNKGCERKELFIANFREGRERREKQRLFVCLLLFSFLFLNNYQRNTCTATSIGNIQHPKKKNKK
jgi:hypothetical protein